MDPNQRAGAPSPLGPSKQSGGINFALYAKLASTVELHIYDKDHKWLTSIKLDPKQNKTGAHAHAPHANTSRPTPCPPSTSPDLARDAACV